MPRAAMGVWSGHLIGQRPRVFLALLLLAATLELAAAVGLAYVAGFGAIWRVVTHVDWPWLVAVVGGLAASFVGYFVAYRRVYEMNDGPRLAHRQMAAVVIAGFGGFIAHGGSALDHYALQAAGVDRRESRVRVFTLAGFEYGVLSVLGTGAAIAVLVRGLAHPTPDFTLPWAVIPIPAFAVAFWLGRRFHGRLRNARGWRRTIGVFLDAIALNDELFLRPSQHLVAIFGMALFWVADAFAVWSGLAAFGFHMQVAALFIGYATGTVFTRRTGPLGGAAVLMLVLPVTIWYSGAPLAACVVAVFSYRVLAFWVPMPFALAGLPALHKLGTRFAQ